MGVKARAKGSRVFRRARNGSGWRARRQFSVVLPAPVHEALKAQAAARKRPVTAEAATLIVAGMAVEEAAATHGTG